MKSVICPYCQTELIGRFRPGDTITCAACKGRFQPPPGMLKEDTESQEVCPFCGTSFEARGMEGDFLQCPSCKGGFTKRPASQKASVTRPKDVTRATQLLAISVVTESVLSVLLFLQAQKSGDGRLMDAAVRTSIGALPYQLLFILFFWNVFKGRNWVRSVFNVLIPLRLLFSVLATLAQNAAEALDQTHSADVEIERWVGLFVLLVLNIAALGYLNSTESRTWLRLPKSRKLIADRPWWLFVLAFVVLCPCLLFWLALSRPAPTTTDPDPPSLREQPVVVAPQRQLPRQPVPMREHSIVAAPQRQLPSQTVSDGNRPVAPVLNRLSVPSPTVPPTAQETRSGVADSRGPDPARSVPSGRPLDQNAQSPATENPVEGDRTEVVDGIPWGFTVENGLATIGRAFDLNFFGHPPAIPYETSGSITIPSSLAGFPVVKIGPGALPCKNLDRITVPGSVKTIGKGAFQYCGAKTIVLEDGVSCIEDRAFLSCRAQSIVLPDSLTSIHDRAFEYCRELKSVFIPSSVKEIVRNPFYGCDNLSAISVSPDNAAFFSRDGVLYDRRTRSLVSYPKGRPNRRYSIIEGTRIIGENAFAWCDQLTTISIPNGVTQICPDAFSYCEHLASISIPDGVSEIGYYAFADTPITDITLPSTVTTMGTNPFNGCSRLRNIRFLGNCPTSSGGITWITIPKTGLTSDEPPRVDNDFFSTRTSSSKEIENPITVYVSRHSTGWDSGLSSADKKRISLRYFD